MKLQVKISDKEAGKTLRDFLKNTLRISSNLLIRLKKEENGIQINGEHKTVRYILQPGDLLTISEPENQTSDAIVATKMPLEILYEDDQIVVVNKAPFVPTHPSHRHYTDSLANGLMYYYQNQKIDFVFRACNRLDKNTSGVVLVAKTQFAAAHITRQIRAHQVQKKYIAILDGILPKTQGTIETYLRRKQESIILREVCTQQDPGSLYAKTDYVVLTSSPTHSIVCAEPVTGRTHQLRVHFSWMGAPITADTLYGSQCTGFPRQALHASQLTIRHPLTQQTQTFMAPLPEDLCSLAKTLGLSFPE